MAATEEVRVRAAFDRVAPAIDDMIEGNPINAWMHRVNRAKLFEIFQPGDRLLELGCGSGADAVALARRGCRVFAFDASEGMVARARDAVAEAALQDRVMIVRGTINDLDAALTDSPWKAFDGAYANFTLTYVGDLEALARRLACAVRPRAAFVCTIPNRVVLSEVLLYGPQLRFRKALWRVATPLKMAVHGSLLEIHALSPAAVRRAFQSSFDLKEMVGVPTFLPPVYLHPYYRRLGGGARLLEFLDGRLAGRFPWNRLGDHTLYRFERRS